ncbi:MAG: hypothetical protein A2289_08255 [Deltaproteobacteria bacterium RIFOXYA12_FULL_58_15]|nr:MAG: hypothetical protein A2289_08255 [Deltaproteobacteria bacterium RIFOXYA12_FULL_58_15]OGR09123.1 MAG: hypothetical protein A2341_10920 [Deltaproteobacteria bacterium RIFOXYB12_FULL_58_9]
MCRTLTPLPLAPLILFCVAGSCASEAKFVEVGEQLLSQKKYDAAIEQFMLALSENPTSPRAHLNLGRTYFELKRFDEAIKAVEQSRSSEDSDDALVVLATIHFERKEYAQAAAFMGKALERSPDNAMHHFRLGMILKTAKDLERAADAFRMAMAQDPALIGPRVYLGLTLKDLMRYEEALEVLKDTVKDVRNMDQSVSQVQSALGEVYEAMQMLDYAIHSYKLAIKNDKKSGTAIAGLGRIQRKQGQLEEAIELLADGAKRVPEHTGLALELGLAYKDFRLVPQAVQELNRVLNLDPSTTEAYRPLIELLEQQKAVDRLSVVLTKAAVAMPDNLEIQLRAGKDAYERKRFDAAIAAFTRALDLERANIDANFYLGMAQAGTGDIEAATESLGALKYLDVGKAEELAKAIEHLKVSPADDPATKTKSKRKGKRKQRRRHRE